MMHPTYTNPVYPDSLPDPFVLKHNGQYWAYGSERSRDGRYFKILHSRDLVHWQEVGGALDEQPGGYECYWAPEVIYWNARFYMYYSLGDEAHMSIRVALSDTPDGLFVDCGYKLTQEEFAIDAHVFEDVDGSHYLFYGTDFLDFPRVGTGTVYDRLLDPFTLSGSPRPVTRARFAWQIYNPHRSEKGGVCWHTLEGPSVLQRKGLYYQMFSGGNWQNTSYGIGYAVTLSLNSEAEWEQACDGTETLPILRSIPEQGIIGPGHNSVVRGPDNRQLYCIYHRWITTPSGSKRAMAADRLEFVGDRLTILGPSNTPQPAPIPPTYTFFTPSLDEVDAGLPGSWHVDSGKREMIDGALVQTSLSGSSAVFWELPAPSFLLEFSIDAGMEFYHGPENASAKHPTWGITLSDNIHETLQVLVLPNQRSVCITHGGSSVTIDLPPAWVSDSIHTVRLEVNHLSTSFTLDGSAVRWRGEQAGLPTHLTWLANDMSVAFSSFQWTEGWEDIFDSPKADLSALGWMEPVPTNTWMIKEQRLYSLPDENQSCLIRKRLSCRNYELVINVQLDMESSIESGYGFGPISDDVQDRTLINLRQVGEGWVLIASDGQTSSFNLPASFDPGKMCQFRMICVDKQLTLSWEGQVMGNLELLRESEYIGLSSYGASACFDMIRVSSIPDARR